MIPRHLDFRRLKQIVTVEQVLSDRGLLEGLSRRGHRLVGPCPIHGGDNPTAFTVDLDKNIWRCFTTCDGGGDVVELARRLTDGTFPAAARYLARLADAGPTPRFTSAIPRRRPPRFQPFTRRLALDPTAGLLARKGISPQTARRYEVGAYHGPGMLSGCIGLRLLAPDGQPLGYAGRRLDPRQVAERGKWVFPPRLPKKALLYGYHQVRHLIHRGAIVTECPWGALRIAQLGIPAVALLGTSLSARQHALLAELPKLVLLLDGDPAGRRAAARTSARLHSSVIANLPLGLDPDDLSNQELLNLLSLHPLLP